jgi:uncharacterized protein (TIGR02996 family)
MSTHTREDWNALESQMKGILAEHASLTESFRVSMTALFAPLEVAARKRADGPFKRKPPISLRLIADSDRPSKLIVLPCHSVRGHGDNRFVTLDCSRVMCELINTDPAPRTSPKRLVLKILPATASTWRYFYLTALDDLHRALKVIQDFVTDRHQVLARAHDHCSICGRRLTDELSRSRGIGPECIQSCSYFLDPRRVVREMTLEDVFREDILRNPDDTSTRLIFADWLEENNRSEEAMKERERAGCLLQV